MLIALCRRRTTRMSRKRNTFELQNQLLAAMPSLSFTIFFLKCVDIFFGRDRSRADATVLSQGPSAYNKNVFYYLLNLANYKKNSIIPRMRMDLAVFFIVSLSSVRLASQRSLMHGTRLHSIHAIRLVCSQR